VGIARANTALPDPGGLLSQKKERTMSLVSKILIAVLTATSLMATAFIADGLTASAATSIQGYEWGSR
jgi:hypothetical protein